MKIKNIILKMVLFTAVLCVSSCETIELDQTEDPSGVSPDLLDPVKVFNYVQLQLPEFVNSANGFTQEVTRQMAMTGGNTYDNAFAPVNSNQNWSTAYSMLNAIKLMEPKAIEKNEYYALGASKVIRAYVLMTLVDMYGDVPLSEALQGAANLNPHFDKSATVYTQVLADLDEAIAILGQDSNPDSKIQDLYYTSQASWITLANTLKLKMYNTARLAGNDIGVPDIGAAMTTIFNSGDYIQNSSQDFAFQYGNSRFTPNSRHPLYNDQYELGGGAYIGNYFMWAMTTEKGITVGANGAPRTAVFSDPRINFYFYKQEANPADADAFTLPNRTRPAHFDDAVYNSFYDSSIRTSYSVSNWTSGASVASNGFWGRDHGDNGGIPPDAESRTVGGIYPIGGKYGNPGTVQNGGEDGALGAGIMPILLSSWVHFMKAEAILELGIAGNARTEFQTGIEQSIDKVINFKPDYIYLAGTAPDPAALQTQRTLYIDFELAKYDEVSAAQKLELIIKEFYIAAWGNGIEPYNNYRRTGYPSNFQPTIEPVSGAFFSTALYSGDSVNNNPNTPTNVRTRKVFWDKANIVLH